MFFYFVWKFNVSNLAQTNYLNHLVFQCQIQCNQIYQIGVKSVTDFVKVLRLLQTGLEHKTKFEKKSLKCNWKFHYLCWFVGIIGQHVTCPKYADCNQAKAKRPKRSNFWPLLCRWFLSPSQVTLHNPSHFCFKTYCCFASIQLAQYIKFWAYCNSYKLLMDRDEPFI